MHCAARFLTWKSHINRKIQFAYSSFRHRRSRLLVVKSPFSCTEVNHQIQSSFVGRATRLMLVENAQMFLWKGYSLAKSSIYLLSSLWLSFGLRSSIRFAQLHCGVLAILWSRWEFIKQNNSKRLDCSFKAFLNFVVCLSCWCWDLYEAFQHSQVFWIMRCNLTKQTTN